MSTPPPGPIPEAVAEVVNEFYGKDPKAAELLAILADPSRELEERVEAGAKLTALERDKIFRERAAKGGVAAAKDPDLWEESPAKCSDVAARGAKAAIAEALPGFMARMRNAPPPSWLVQELLPDSGIAIWHGRPRSMKSLTAADVVLSLALGEPHALNNARFKIPAATSGLVLAEEDSERLYGFRLGSMLTARGILPGQEPDTFRLVVRPGWNLETPHGQAELLAVIRETSAAMTTPLVVLVIDPARASMPGIDGGPLDASKARAFLFSIMRETTIKVILLVHHDTKPRSDGKDDRARAERASGGVTFSIGDAMIGFERLNDRECLAVPSSYKAGADPRPFKVCFESETPSGEAFRGFIRAKAEAADEASSVRERVLDFVRANPWSSTSDVDKGVHVRAGEASRYLAQLESAGLIAHETGPQAKARGKAYNAVLWGCP